MKKVKYAYIPWGTEEESRLRLQNYPKLSGIDCEVINIPNSLINEDDDLFGFKVKYDDVQKWCDLTKWGNRWDLTFHEFEENIMEDSDYKYVPSKRSINV